MGGEVDSGGSCVFGEPTIVLSAVVAIDLIVLGTVFKVSTTPDA